MAKPRLTTHPLTEKERRWLVAYGRHGNKARAVREAGYDVDPDDVGLHSAMGAQIGAKPHIAARIEAMRVETLAKYAVTEDNVIAELAKIAFGNIADLYTIQENGYPVLDMTKVAEHQLAAIAEIKETKDGLSIKMHSKLEALKLLGQHLKMWTADTEINVTLDLSDRIMRARQRAAMEIEHADGGVGRDPADEG